MKVVTKINHLLLLSQLILLLFVFYDKSFAQIFRSTTFDERPLCEKSDGIWRDYGNGCGDLCEYKFEKYPICTYQIFFSCDCGSLKCWNGEKCVLLQDYKKIYDEAQIENQKIIEEAKKKRRKQFLKIQRERFIVASQNAKNAKMQNQQDPQNQQNVGNQDPNQNPSSKSFEDKVSDLINKGVEEDKKNIQQDQQNNQNQFDESNSITQLNPSKNVGNSQNFSQSFSDSIPPAFLDDKQQKEFLDNKKNLIDLNQKNPYNTTPQNNYSEQPIFKIQ